MVGVLVECNHVRRGFPMATVTNSEFLFSPTQIEMVGTTVNLPVEDSFIGIILGSYWRSMVLTFRYVGAILPSYVGLGAWTDSVLRGIGITTDN